MLELTPHQEEAVSRMSSEPTRAVLNGSEVGTGKTVMAVETIKRIGNNVNLITAPLHTRDGWEKHFDSQAAGELRWVNNKTKSGKNAWSDLRFGVPGNYFMGRELARLQDWTGVPIGTLITDECHTLTDPKSRGFKAYSKPGTQGRDKSKGMTTDYRMFQSATWFGSSFEGAWSIARLLWPDLDGYEEIADRSRYRWIDSWCSWEYDHFAPMNKKVVGEKVPGKFATDAPCYVKIASDLPEIEPIEIRYELTPEQRRLYKRMEEDSLIWLNENPLSADLPVTQRIRLREIALAEPMLDEFGAVQYAPDAKSALFDTMVAVLGDLLGEQVLMATHSAKFARYVAGRLPSTFAWTGDKSDADRADAKASFIAGDTRNIVATQAAIAEGVDSLHLASHIMFELSLNDNPILNEQFRGRLRRRNQEKPVVCYRFVGVGTIDDEQHESLLKKELAMRASLR